MMFHQRANHLPQKQKPQKINKRVMTSQLLNIKKNKIKATDISETTTLTAGSLFVLNDANAAGSLTIKDGYHFTSLILFIYLFFFTAVLSFG